VLRENGIKSQTPTFISHGPPSTTSSILFQGLTICYDGVEKNLLDKIELL
jgi:hypothetical protein